MNQWGNEQYMMMPLMGANMGHAPNIGPGLHMGSGPNLGPGPSMGGPALLPTPMPTGPPGSDGIVPPLVPPRFLFNEWSAGKQSDGPGGDNPANLIGSKRPDVDFTTDKDEHHGIQNQGNEHPNRNSRDNRDQRDGRGEKDRGEPGRGRRQRSPFNRNRERNERGRSDRRERRPRWSDNKDVDQPEELMTSMMIPGNNIPYGNMMNVQPGMDLASIQNMMPNMVPNMMANMMPNMSNIIPGMNMVDQNMLMMQQMPMNNQPIYISSGVLLPPLPNITLPSRRERPLGCRTIYVGGLPQGIGEDAIREIFQRFGFVDIVKLYKQEGVGHVRFSSQELVEASFFLSGFRFKRHDQAEHEATSLFIDYALNRDDQSEYERNKRRRSPTPPRIEPFSPTTFSAIGDKIKSDTEFSEAAATLVGWLERGECNKKNAHAFYSLIQASNNQVRRLYTEKITIDEEFQTVKGTLKEKFANIILQFEQVGKILTAAKVQRVSDHFNKQQRRNIEMWLKMTEDVENIKEEFNSVFDEDEADDMKNSKTAVILKKYEELKVERKNLQYELEGYKNEAHLAKDEAERKFEKFKAHFIAQQALQNTQPMHQQQMYPPLPPPPPETMSPAQSGSKSTPPPSPSVAPSEAKLISVLTAFLLVHPLGASLDYLVSYVRSIIPTATQSIVHNILQKYSDVFSCQTSGVGANIEHKWTFVTFDVIKKEIS